ncbi:uncharacterized protein LOC128872293 [Hylaeus volcanicus]|uniref:uncharacterized protein LOC128872293 n=1 Tax=Hylaeus volcanicus TaxID=313075 RepID=UPI0023B836F4|nr:uncharacterized protein LOC128872293 [Hylaeus volcanicus]
MHYRWEKRTMQVDEAKINELNDFPLELLRISPNHGILYPFNAHYFNVTARCNNLLPNRYSAILQLYVEDIPLAAIPKKLQLHTKECGKKRRNCLISVDILVADVKVWVQYMMNDEWKTSESEELIESISETIPEYKYSLEDEETEWKDDTDDSEGYKSMRQLVADELFSHYDIVNLLQFKSLLWERIISMGIIRPTRTLYIGIEETYGLIVKNFSNNLLTYAWGDTNGFDVEKVKLCVCPEKGEIQAKNTQKIEITLLPLKEGLVESLFIPCFVGNSQKMIMLGIECFIQPLYVTFYLPLNNPEPLKARDTFARIEWRVDSLKAALDSAGKIKEGMKLLNRYKMRAERELKNTNLDQGDVLKDASVGPSVSDVGAENSNEQCSSSARTSEIIQMSKLAAEDSKHSEEDAAVSGHVVPFLETILPPLTQRDVIEFLGLSLRTVEKKTFVIKNETPIPSNFQLRLKNFYPVKCSCERKSKEDRIKFMYKQVYHRNKDLIEETLRRLKQPKSGVVIYVDPLNSDMGPFEAIPVNIYVFADTWGIYVDELDIDITGLPRYTLSVCVQVVDPPISLSICENTSTKTHHLKFGLVSAGMRLQPRKVLLKNTGVVPVAVDWHSFLISPEKEPMPFSIIYDIYTPFTDKLARELKASKQKSRSESHMEHHVTERVKSKIYEFDSIGVGDSVADASSTIPSASDEATMLTCT